MPNPYLTLYRDAPESSLIEDLYGEAIFNLGFAGNYLPNTNNQARDLIYGDDPLKKFTEAYTLDMYLLNTYDYSDEQDFFSKFGLEVRNQVKIQIASREFEKIVGIYPRPREGDLIFIPFFKDNGELFEIKFVNTSKDLYTLGRKKPYYYELSLEPFKYNDEEIDTGIEEIDIIEDIEKFKTTLDFVSGSGNYIHGETIYQGTPELHIASAEVLDWDAEGTLLYVINVTGDFNTNSLLPIYGASSFASYILTHESYTLEKQFDNIAIQDESITFLDPSSGSLKYDD